MSPALAEKLLEWERRREGGTPVTPEELCADWPEGLEEVRRQIRRLEACDRLLGLAEDLEATGGWTGGPPDVLPPRVDQFEVRGRLGSGGMAEVYDGWDPALGRVVAIKVLRPPPDGRPSARQVELAGRFAREGEILAQLDHEHIVRVYQAGVWEGRPYLVMARIGGGSLSERLADLAGRGPWAVAAFMEQVARAVATAHALGVLHRDLKPANILLDANGAPRVSDFGLAKWWAAAEVVDPDSPTDPDGPAELTSPGTQPGTPGYMAPEQFDPARGAVGPATDVWALGVILFELLTGRRPFAGETRRELVARICRAPTPSCRAVRRQVPRWLDAVVAHCLAKAPDDRYPSAAALADALRAGRLRHRRRMWLAGTAAVLGLVLMTGLAAGRYWPRPTDAPNGDPRPVAAAPRFEDTPEVVAALAVLGRREEVVLVEPGRVAPFRSLFGSETVRVIEDGRYPLTLDSRWPGVSAVEFLPRLPEGSYRVIATLRHDSGGDHSKLGLYIGGRYWVSNDGQHLSCVALQFLDGGSEAARPPVPGQKADADVRLRTLLTGAVRTEQNHWEGQSFGQFDDTAATPGQSGFRRLVLHVTPESVTAEWERNAFGKVHRRDAANAQELQLEGYPELNPADRPANPFTGGVGLLIKNGTVNVQDLRIVPE